MGEAVLPIELLAVSWEKLFYQLHYRQCHGRSYFTHWTTGSVTGEAISPITLPVVSRKGENLIALPGCTWGEKRKLIFTIKIITSITKCMFYSTLGSQTQKRDCVVYQASRLLCIQFFFLVYESINDIFYFIYLTTELF